MDAFIVVKKLGCIWFAKIWGTGQDNFKCVVFNFKFISGTGQTDGQIKEQKHFCLSLNHEKFFVLCINCLKY
jgi:hypothetical protein